MTIEESNPEPNVALDLSTGLFGQYQSIFSDDILDQEILNDIQDTEDLSLLRHKILNEFNIKELDRNIESSLKLIAQVCEFALIPGSTITYNHGWELRGSRGFSQEELKAVDLEFLMNSQEFILNKPLRFRILDLLWLKMPSKKKFEFAKLALEVAKNHFDSLIIESPESFDFRYFERIMVLALQIGDHEKFGFFCDKAIQIHDSLCDISTNYLQPGLSFLNSFENFVSKFDEERKLKLLGGMEREASRWWVEGYYDRSGEYFKKLIKLAHNQKNEKIAIIYNQEFESLLIEQSEDILNDAQDSAIGKTTKLREIVENLCLIGMHTHIARLKREIYKVGQNIKNEMGRFDFECEMSLPFDLKDLTNDSLEEVVKVLLKYSTFPQKSEFEKFGESFDGSPLLYIMPKITVDHKGKRISQREGKAAAIDFGFGHWINTLRIYYEPMFNRLKEESSLVSIISEMLESVLPKVIELKKYQMLQAILSGFRKDFLLATYLCPAMLEDLLRQHISENGGSIVTNHQGDEMEILLSRVLDCSELTTLLGDDLVSYLKYVLERDGINLRNSVYHGLIEDSEILSDGFLLWHTLWVTVLQLNKKKLGIF